MTTIIPAGVEATPWHNRPLTVGPRAGVVKPPIKAPHHRVWGRVILRRDDGCHDELGHCRVARHLDRQPGPAACGADQAARSSWQASVAHSVRTLRSLVPFRSARRAGSCSPASGQSISRRQGRRTAPPRSRVRRLAWPSWHRDVLRESSLLRITVLRIAVEGRQGEQRQQ